MKTQTKIIIGFYAEAIFFILTGIYFGGGKYISALIPLIFAMITAGYVGNLIEKDGVEKYKEGLK